LFKLTALRKGEKGEALVELVMVLPILLLVIMGLFQSVLIIADNLILIQASQGACRPEVVDETDEQICEPIWTLTQRLKNGGEITVKITATDKDGNPQDGPNTHDLDVRPTPDDDEDEPWPNTNKEHPRIEVEIEYAMSLEIPIIREILPNPLHLRQGFTVINYEYYQEEG